MKPQKLLCLASLISLSAFALASWLAAQDPAGPPHYRVIDLGTLGGSASAGNAINNIGWVTGFSTKSDGTQLATLWANGVQTPLGTLGGPNSDVAWPLKNNFGLISGVSENGVHDPLNETFSCPAFGLVSGNSCVAFAWQDGVMTELPGLGGNNSIGAGENDLGQVVGWAEKNVVDPTCAPQFPAPRNSCSLRRRCGSAIAVALGACSSCLRIRAILMEPRQPSMIWAKPMERSHP